MNVQLISSVFVQMFSQFAQILFNFAQKVCLQLLTILLIILNVKIEEGF